MAKTSCRLVLLNSSYSQLFCPFVYLYMGLSAFFFYLTWRGNGLANLEEVWQVGPPCAILAPKTPALLSSGQQIFKIDITCHTLRLLQLSSEDAEIFVCNIFDGMHTKSKCFRVLI